MFENYTRKNFWDEIGSTSKIKGNLTHYSLNYPFSMPQINKMLWTKNFLNKIYYLHVELQTCRWNNKKIQKHGIIPLKENPLLMDTVDIKIKYADVFL